MLTVRHILCSKGSNQIWSISPDDPVMDAVSCMARHDIGALLVIETNRVVGIVSERDYVRHLSTQDGDCSRLTVADIMTVDVHFGSPTDRIDHCLSLMTERRFRHLPIEENGLLLGMLSMGDIVKAIITEQEFLIEQLTNYITGSTVDLGLMRLQKH